MMTTEFAGIYPYLVTPVDEFGDLNESQMRAQVRMVLDAGVDGVSPLGSTGDIMYLSPRTRRRVVEVVVDEVAGTVPVVPAVAAYSTREIAAEAGQVTELGADGVVVMQMSYFASRPRDVVDYFTAAADGTNLPVVLYTNPKLGAELSVEVISELSTVANIAYLKDATGRTGRLASVQRACGDRLRIFAASAHIPATVFELGGVGWMGGPICLAPELSLQLWRSHLEGRREDMWRIQRALWPLNELFSQHGLSAIVKAGLAMRGLEMGPPISPQAPVPPHAVAELEQILRDLPTY